MAFPGFGCSGTPARKPPPAHTNECCCYCCTFPPCRYDCAELYEAASDTAPLWKEAEQLCSPPLTQQRIFRWIWGGGEAVWSQQKELWAGGAKEGNGLLWTWWSCSLGAVLSEWWGCRFCRSRLHQSTESAGTPWEEQPGGSGEWGATMP